MPARSGESMSSCSWRSPTTCSVISWRRWSPASPASRASRPISSSESRSSVDDVAELLGDVVVDAAEVVLLELVATLAAQLLEHLADALDALAVLVLEARLHHAAQGRVEVAVVEQVVGDLAEDVVGVRARSRPASRPNASTRPVEPSSWGEGTGPCRTSRANESARRWARRRRPRRAMTVGVEPNSYACRSWPRTEPSSDRPHRHRRRPGTATRSGGTGCTTTPG